MSEAAKNGQLRVRVDQDSLRELAQIATSRPNQNTISDLVREAISYFLERKGQNPPPDLVTNACLDGVLKLAEETERAPAQVLEECVEGIQRLLKTGETPLIVLELRLRRKYIDHRERRSGEADCRLITRSLEQLPEPK
jgi:hypothetical protein